MINNEENIKFGFVTIVGKPNAGKSTLLNSILEQKIAITTHRKNTTRNQIKGIYNDDDSQIVFIDTPGFLESKNKLDEKMKKTIMESTKNVDVILFLEPFWKDIDKEYIEKLKLLNNNSKKIYLITQIDKTKDKTQIFKRGEEIIKEGLFDEVVPISSFKGSNIDTLIELIKKSLKVDHAYYERNKAFEFDDKFYVAEIIREKILVFLNYEIPHQSFVKVVSFENSKNLVKIKADIYVSKNSQKMVIIGENGEKIKQISSKARIEMEEYFGKKVFLEIFIKVRKDWQNKESIIKEI